MKTVYKIQKYVRKSPGTSDGFHRRDQYATFEEFSNLEEANKKFTEIYAPSDGNWRLIRVMTDILQTNEKRE